MMKTTKLNYFLAFLGMLSFGVLTGCNKEEEDPTPGNQDPGIENYQTVLLGNQKNTTAPSFYASSTNTKYNAAEAKTNSADVDFGYGNGSQAGNEYFVGAPDDESIIAVYPDVVNWTTKNATRFKLTDLNEAAFDSISTEESLLAAVAAGTDPFKSSRVRGTEIEEGKVVAFTTAEGKKGLLLIEDRSGTTTASGSITLNVKVQKND